MQSDDSFADEWLRTQEQRAEAELSEARMRQRQANRESILQRSFQKAGTELAIPRGDLATGATTDSGRNYFLRYARILRLIGICLRRAGILPSDPPATGTFAELAFRAMQRLSGTTRIRAEDEAAAIQDAVRRIDPLIDGKPNSPRDNDGHAPRYLHKSFWFDLARAAVPHLKDERRADPPLSSAPKTHIRPKHVPKLREPQEAECAEPLSDAQSPLLNTAEWSRSARADMLQPPTITDADIAKGTYPLEAAPDNVISGDNSVTSHADHTRAQTSEASASGWIRSLGIHADGTYDLALVEQFALAPSKVMATYVIAFVGQASRILRECWAAENASKPHTEFTPEPIFEHDLLENIGRSARRFHDGEWTDEINEIGRLERLIVELKKHAARPESERSPGDARKSTGFYPTDAATGRESDAKKRRRIRRGEANRVIAAYIEANAHRRITLAMITAETGINRSTASEQRAWKIYRRMSGDGDQPRDITKSMRDILDPDTLKRLVAEQQRETQPRRRNRCPTRDREADR